MKDSIVALFILVASISFANTGNAADGFMSRTVVIKCSEYLDAYASAKLDGLESYKGKPNAWRAFGYIDGYVSAYNFHMRNGIANILSELSGNDNVRDDIRMNDARRWIASYCRDNTFVDLSDAIDALFTMKSKRIKANN